MDSTIQKYYGVTNTMLLQAAYALVYPLTGAQVGFCQAETLFLQGCRDLSGVAVLSHLVG